MFRKILLIGLVMFGLIAGSAMASDFNAVYDKAPECFMSLDYTLYQGAAPNVWVVKYNKPMFERKYLREGGDIWRNAGVMQEEALPCGTAKTAIPAWFCPEPAPVVLAAVTPPPVVPKTFIVYFDFDKSVLTNDSVATLTAAVSYAQEHGYSQIELASFCDFRGSDDYNVGLSERRSTAVQHWMIENGIGTSGFEVEDNGEFKSMIKKLDGRYCATCWEDRRVEITIK